jgi:hypothetical protein
MHSLYYPACLCDDLRDVYHAAYSTIFSTLRTHTAPNSTIKAPNARENCAWASLLARAQQLAAWVAATAFAASKPQCAMHTAGLRCKKPVFPSHFHQFLATTSLSAAAAAARLQLPPPPNSGHHRRRCASHRIPLPPLRLRRRTRAGRPCSRVPRWSSSRPNTILPFDHWHGRHVPDTLYFV